MSVTLEGTVPVQAVLKASGAIITAHDGEDTNVRVGRHAVLVSFWSLQGWIMQAAHALSLMREMPLKDVFWQPQGGS